MPRHFSNKEKGGAIYFLEREMGGYAKLGSMVQEYEVFLGPERAVLLIRGMNVGEYIDLSIQGVLRLSQELYMRLAYTCIVGWRNISIEDEYGNITDEFKPEHLDSFPESILMEVGEYIYYNMSEVSAEEEQKLRGYMRFLFWSSKDENKNTFKTFDCNTCLKLGLAKGRNCSKFTDKEIDYQHKRLNGIDTGPEPEKKAAADIKSRYKAKRNKTFSSVEEAHDAAQAESLERSGDIVRLHGCNFDFPECPISWVDDWLKDVGSILYTCEKSNIPFFDGGMANQSYKFYKMAKIVSGESSEIESEEIDKSKKEIERKK